MIDWSWWLHFAGGMVVGFIAMRVAKRLCRRLWVSLTFPWGCELSGTSTYDGPVEIKGIIDRRDPPPVVPGDKYAYTVKYYRPRRFLWPKLVAVYHQRFRADGSDYCEIVFDIRRCRIGRWVSHEDVKMRRPGELRCWFHKTDGCDSLRAAQRRDERKGLAPQ